MISYEDARQIREKANAPLTWDETVPAPPIDRIELTRRILETAELVGLDFPKWDKSFPHTGPEKEIERFQERMRQFIPKQTAKGIPGREFHGLPNGMMADGIVALKGGDYIELLEEDYFKPWETSWRLGICADSKANVHLLIKAALADEIESVKAWFGDESRSSKYPDPEKINKDEAIAAKLNPLFGLHPSNHLRWYAGLRLDLVQERWMGLPELWSLAPPLTVGLFCLVGSIVGAVQGRYSGWLLFAIIPSVVIGTLVAGGKILYSFKKYWLNPKMTFDELAEKVVALKKHEWAELQQTYTAQ